MDGSWFAQSYLLLQKHLIFSIGQIESLSDDAFTMHVAQALWLEEREIEVVKQGVLRALAEAFS